MSGFCNAGERMSLGKWWLWALLGLLALYLLMLFSNWRDIEGDIQDRTQAALNDNGHSWASVDQANRGRDVLITGMAPDESAVNEAVSLVQKVRGVRVVESEPSFIEWVSSRFGLSTKQDKTTLTGMMPNQPSIDRVVQAVTNSVGVDNIDNQLQINTSAKEPQWLDKVIAALPVLGSLQNAELQAEDGVFSAAGDVKSDAEKNDIYTLMSESFGRNFDGRINVTGPSADELAEMAAAEQKRKEEAAAMAAEALKREDETAALAAEEKKRDEEAVAMAQSQPDVDKQMKLDRSMFLDTCQSKFNQIMQAKKIQFATSSATISVQSFPLLRGIISLVQECNQDGGLTIEIAGHTDDTGNDSANLSLSDARANSVMQYLLQSGVDQNVLSAKGYGESKPIAENSSAEGRAQNRRIQFNIQR